MKTSQRSMENLWFSQKTVEYFQKTPKMDCYHYCHRGPFSSLDNRLYTNSFNSF